MRKEINKKTGETGFFFNEKEIKRIKIAGIGLAVLIVAALSGSVYSIYAMQSLRAENNLYRNQLQMAEQRMDKLVKKSETVDKLSEQMKSMMQGNQPAAQTSESGTGGQGGASTVPDKARDVSPSQSGNASSKKSESKVKEGTPGQLLNDMVDLDNKLNQQIKTIISLRTAVMTEYYGSSLPAVYSGSAMPSIWPVHGSVSSTFGFRSSPGGIGSTYHEGVDIAVDYGTPVKATANGRVTQAGWVGGYGYLVEIDHGNGIVTRYGHNSALLVNVGDEVTQGQTISLAGSTGNSTGPHSHYEVRVNGDAVDPMLFLPQN